MIYWRRLNRRRLVMTLELIREVEAERNEAADGDPKDRACGEIANLCRIRGVGANFAAVLTREVFYPFVRQPAATRQLRRHYADALPKRRHRQGSADQSGREPKRENDNDPACVALA